MPKISLKKVRFNKRRLGAAVFAAVILILLPVFALSSHKNNIYVDDDASGEQDGSIHHPYRTIHQAMDRANGETDIHVADGTYKENVTIRMKVKIYGESKDDTIIKADDSDDDVVTMKDNTKIDKVTIKGGKNGIKVKDKAKASIIDCVIKDNDRDGIRIESDGTDDDKMVSISDSVIEKNDRSGIFSGRRRLSITDVTVKDNDKDGIDIAAGSRVWMAHSNIKENGGSGLKMTIDDSDIWTKDNRIRDNGREGLEVTWNGDSGRINIKDDSFIGNDNYGIARLQASPVKHSDFSEWDDFLTYEGDQHMFDNGKGNVSNLIEHQ